MDSSQGFSDFLDNVKMTYQTASEGLTWRVVITYGGILMGTWVFYRLFLEHLFSPLRTLPSAPFNPFVGNMRELVRGEAMEATIKLMKEVGNVSRYFFMFGRERVMVAEPDTMKHILVTNSKNYIKPPTRLKLMRLILGDGLVNLEGATHAAHKRLMSPFFNNNAVKKMVPVITKRSQKLVEHWKKEVGAKDSDKDGFVELAIQNDLCKTTLDIVGEVAFSYDFNSFENPDQPVNTAFQRILTGGGFNWRFAIPNYHTFTFMPDVKRFRRDVKLMHDAVIHVIENKKQQLSQGGGESDVANDVLGQMLLARDENGQGMTTNELRSEVMTLMSAGHETTASGVSWALLVLAQNPVIQERAREEAMRVLPSDPEQVTWDHLDQLKYIGCVVKESLRLLPPVPLTLRQATGPDQIHLDSGKTQHIPAGTIILLAMGPMMRRPDLFESPNEFVPERFLDGELDKKFYNYLPFLVGHRMCIGYRFALLEMRAMLAFCLRDLRFQTVPGVVHKRQSRITMRPTPSLRLMVSRVATTTTPDNHSHHADSPRENGVIKLSAEANGTTKLNTL